MEIPQVFEEIVIKCAPKQIWASQHIAAGDMEFRKANNCVYVFGCLLLLFTFYLKLAITMQTSECVSMSAVSLTESEAGTS